MTSNIFSLIRRKTLSLIRNLWKITMRQLKEAKILLAGLIANFLIFSLRSAFFPSFDAQIVGLALMSAVLGVSLFAFFHKEKSDVPDAYRNLIPKQ